MGFMQLRSAQPQIPDATCGEARLAARALRQAAKSQEDTSLTGCGYQQPRLFDDIDTFSAFETTHSRCLNFQPVDLALDMGLEVLYFELSIETRFLPQASPLAAHPHSLFQAGPKQSPEGNQNVEI